MFGTGIVVFYRRVYSVIKQKRNTWYFLTYFCKATQGCMSLTSTGIIATGYMFFLKIEYYLIGGPKCFIPCFKASLSMASCVGYFRSFTSLKKSSSSPAGFTA